jgi:hypothetical protein
MRFPAESPFQAVPADRCRARAHLLLLAFVVLAGCGDLPSTPGMPEEPEAPEPEGPRLTFGTAAYDAAQPWPSTAQKMLHLRELLDAPA